MSNRLDEILATKREEVAARKAASTLDALDARARSQEPTRGFEAALRTHSREGFGLIAEIKRASPSKGLIRADFDPPALARAYEAGGAACLSILTDEQYFQGADSYLSAARAATARPCLRKDFTVDPWQVAEARAIGADAILVIVAALEDEAMAEIEAAAVERGMDVLVEVHDMAELERALNLRSRLIGVNNRDLRDFSVDPTRAWDIADKAPPGCLLVSESGISGHDDLRAAADHGIRAFLVGESLMRQADVEAATRALLGT